MEERRLGPSSASGPGTRSTRTRRSHGVVGSALDASVTFFDTSPMYRGAEASLGAALEGRRDRSDRRDEDLDAVARRGARAVRRQLGWYGRVELQQVHNLVAWQEHLPWLEDERDTGRIDLLGVTHYASSSFDELARALRTGRFDAVQLPYSLAERTVERELLSLAAELGVRVVVMRPLVRPARRDGAAARGAGAARPFGDGDVAQALLKWILSDERVDVVIPATSRPARAAENAAAGSPPWFGPDERGYVERLARNESGRDRDRRTRAA